MISSRTSLSIYRTTKSLNLMCDQEQLAVKSGTLTSVFSEVERLKEENWRLEKQCNNTSRQLELVNRESTNDSEVSRNQPMRVK